MKKRPTKLSIIFVKNHNMAHTSGTESITLCFSIDILPQWSSGAKTRLEDHIKLCGETNSHCIVGEDNIATYWFKWCRKKWQLSANESFCQGLEKNVSHCCSYKPEVPFQSQTVTYSRTLNGHCYEKDKAASNTTDRHEGISTYCSRKEERPIKEFWLLQCIWCLLLHL